MRFCGKYFVAAFAFALIAASQLLVAQERFPSRPIEIVVPTPAGGGTDIATRLLAEVAEPMLGQKLVVVNKPGVSGIIAPKGLPPDRLAILEKAFVQASKSDKFRESMESKGVTALGGNAAELQKLIDSEHRAMADVARSVGLSK